MVPTRSCSPAPRPTIPRSGACFPPRRHPELSAAPARFRATSTVNINGIQPSYNSGVLLAANTVVNGNFASIDNIVAPYEAAGVYRVSSMDNSGPGELDPTVSPESSSFALGFFPYADGWIGANIVAGGSVSGSSSLPAGVLITNTDVGVYQITGLPDLRQPARPSDRKRDRQPRDRRPERRQLDRHRPR